MKILRNIVNIVLISIIAICAYKIWLSHDMYMEYDVK